jgi:hypothetical protein
MLIYSFDPNYILIVRLTTVMRFIHTIKRTVCLFVCLFVCSLAIYPLIHQLTSVIALHFTDSTEQLVEV